MVMKDHFTANQTGPLQQDLPEADDQLELEQPALKRRCLNAGPSTRGQSFLFSDGGNGGGYNLLPLLEPAQEASFFFYDGDCAFQLPEACDASVATASMMPGNAYLGSCESYCPASSSANNSATEDCFDNGFNDYSEDIALSEDHTQMEVMEWWSAEGPFISPHADMTQLGSCPSVHDEDQSLAWELLIALGHPEDTASREQYG